MNGKANRLDMILEFLQHKNGASIKELATAFDVSEMTIRRDLTTLCKRNIVNLVHGAAIYNPDYNNSPFVLDGLYTKNLMQDEKERIGKMAASFVESGDVIIIDSGSTTEKLAEHIEAGANIDVYCYSLNALTEICSKDVYRVTMCGGTYQPNTQTFVCPEGVSILKSTRAQKMFLSTTGVSSQLDLTCGNFYEVETKIAGINSSQTQILLTDSSKFDKIRSNYFANLKEVDIVITDTGLSEEWRETIKAAGVELYLA